MPSHHSRRLILSPSLLLAFAISQLPLTYAKSSQAAIEWALFNEILLIGIAVGIVVYGLLFYVIIRFREKPATAGAK